MSNPAVQVPDLMPVLSAGKHRNPRKGACFMELAAFLAGERWSDHPRCTHPLLAALARSVNDLTSDTNRSRLAPLIPQVIGLTGDDIRIDAVIALQCARTALPVASAERQCALAVSIINTERLLAELDGRPAEPLPEASQRALARAPYAARQAGRLVREVGVSQRGFRRHAAPATVQCAVAGVAQACIDDPDDLLFDMLAGAIRDCAEVVNQPPPELVAAWDEACALTHR
ncbi:MAG: hypothetical protein M3353_07855 [Actinomycetota bacterium]|nr:hypothetical protein [Actinomycetota bacterium]